MADCGRCLPVACGNSASHRLIRASKRAADGTFRICFSLLGQPRFDAPAASRHGDGSSSKEVVHRVLSIRGRSGSVLGLAPAKDESASQIAECLHCALSDTGLEQVEHIATDSPSLKLHTTLAAICPRFRGLSLDPTHAAMRYEQASFGRRTAGSSLLRSFMAKFSGHDRNIAGDIWGPMFAGQDAVPLSQQEARLRQQILSASMPRRKAAQVIDEAAGHVVWRTRIQFIEALAALAARHKDEMSRKLDGTSIRVDKILHALAGVDKVEWLFNSLRYRRALPLPVRMLLPSGTTSNEALHAELNSWFRQTQRMHRSTLALKLQCLQLGKLLAHSAALYMPSARQMPWTHVLARALPRPLFNQQTWQRWVVEQRRTQTGGHKNLPLPRKRCAEQEAVAGTFKKPAFSKTRKKRTAFTLERINVIGRSGRAKRPAASQKH